MLLSAYHAQSHQYWCESLIREFPEFEWLMLTLPPRFFAWRIRGNPLSFIAQYQQQLSQNYDLCIATSMVDVATIKGLVPSLAATPSIVYFHENQFAYPASQQQNTSLEPLMVNLYAALAADQLVFNSQFNLRTFTEGVDELMSKMPDCAPEHLGREILQKSQVLQVPLTPLDDADYAMANKTRIKTSMDKPMQLLWNHRWEYDKNPELLLQILQELEFQKTEVVVHVVGQQFRHSPAVFNAIESLLNKSQILTKGQWGYLADRADYQQCIQQSTFVLSTAIHDFQGLSILEAVDAGCIPILPNKLVYPEWFAVDYLYDSQGSIEQQAQAAVACIHKAVHQVTQQANQRNSLDMSGFYWRILKPQYRQLIESHLQV